MTVSDKEHDEALRKLKDWLIDEGYEFQKAPTPHENNVFEVKVKYPKDNPGGNVLLLRPKNRPAISVVMNINLAEQHQSQWNALDADQKEALMLDIRITAFSGGEVGFGPEVQQGMLTSWTLDYFLYDEELNRQHLFMGMRKVFTKHLQIIEVMKHHLEGDVPDRGSGASDLSGYR